MSMISYAQNFEDVMLWRALKGVENGFYIDIGALIPHRDSVTKHFYLNGWFGINVEPILEYQTLFEQERPRDINLAVAVGDQEGCLPIYLVNGLGGLATLDPSTASMHHQAGLEIGFRTIEVKTLKSIWEAHVPKNQPVHFLKIDVEGYEEKVLRSNDWEKCRPWILVVEATIPNSPKECHYAWEPILLAANYVLAYADGLNRFYVARERQELCEHFKYPPNFFDYFVPTLLVEAEEQKKLLDDQIRSLQNELDQMNFRLCQITQLANDQENRCIELEKEHTNQQAELRLQAQKSRESRDETLRQLHAILNSKSWQITKPLRIVNYHFHPLIRLVIKRPIKKILYVLSGYLKKHPRVSLLFKALLEKFPVINERIVAILKHQQYVSRNIVNTTNKVSPQTEADMSPCTKLFYRRIKAALPALEAKPEDLQ